MSCGTPVAFATLVEAAAGELSDAERTAVEDHVFACDQCGAAYARLLPLVDALRASIPPAISPHRLKRLRDEGQRLRITNVNAGEHVQVLFSRDVDLLIHVLRGDLAGARSVDLELFDTAGTRLGSVPDVPFDPVSGEVIIACQRHYMLHYPADIRFRLHRITEAGREPAGDYSIDHRF